MGNISAQRIAKNTMLLYIRMVVIMLITLYTSRIVLKILGIEGYGLYNVIGGIVVLFSFLNTAMSSASQRFITYELGIGSKESQSKIFSISMTAHIVIVLIVIFFAETIGLYFLNNYIQIPNGKENIANYIYQFSIISICFNILSVPYSASVIAHEEMGVYSIISITDACAKLAIAFIIPYVNFERLITYSLLIASVSVINFVLYRIICIRRYAMCSYHFIMDRALFKKIFSFSGWSLCGQMAVVGMNQGNNFLINIFYTVAVNATMGITNQVNAAVQNMVSSFQMAFQPQITKAYAARDYISVNKLVYQSAKLSYFLLFVFAVPLIIYMKPILQWWLNNVPEYADLFCSLTIVVVLVNSISGPLVSTIFASGKIKRYQIWISLIFIIDLPIVYTLFILKFPAYYVMVISLIIHITLLFIRILFTKQILCDFSMKNFYRNVLLQIIMVSVISIMIYIFFNTISNNNNIFFQLLFNVIAFLFSIVVVYFIGLNTNEKKIIKNYIYKKINK